MTSEGSPPPSEAFVWVWLPGKVTPAVAGRIAREGDIHTFNYGRSYLERPDAIPLYLPELPLGRGAIRPLGQLTMANCLRDGAPDAWGRRVIINRLTGRRGADAEAADLDELTFMLESGSDRIGALDFQTSATVYTPRQTEQAQLEELLESAERVERGVPLSPDLDRALNHGSSIGGARPKALITAPDRKLIAKFSASNDTYSVVKGEFVAMKLAALAGLDVAPVRMERASGKDALLVERFDRTKVGAGWTRRSIVSALTLEELHELSGHHAGYDTLAEIVRTRFTNPAATLKELFSRMVFNILVGNTDDHARNHAAFWDGERLSLTPAYDICPQARNSRERNQAIAIHTTEKRSQLIHCLTAAPAFHLREEEALGIVTEQVRSIRRNWRRVCDSAGLTETDRDFFWKRQFLNAYAFEGMENRLRDVLAGL
jgi:serine/threonine-protein kinase HipA